MAYRRKKESLAMSSQSVTILLFDLNETFRLELFEYFPIISLIIYQDCFMKFNLITIVFYFCVSHGRCNIMYAYCIPR